MAMEHLPKKSDQKNRRKLQYRESWLVKTNDFRGIPMKEILRIN